MAFLQIIHKHILNTSVLHQLKRFKDTFFPSQSNSVHKLKSQKSILWSFSKKQKNKEEKEEENLAFSFI